MNGYQLMRARQLLRMERRHIAITQGRMTGAFHALDPEHFLELVGLDAVGAPGNVVKLVVLARGLRGLGIAEGEIPRALHLTAAELKRLEAIPLLDPDRGGEAIDAAILLELPETRDPGEYTPEAAALNDQPRA